MFTHRLDPAARLAAPDGPTPPSRSTVEVSYGVTAATDPFRLRLELRRSRGSAMPPPDLVVDDGDVLWEVQGGTVRRRTYRVVARGPTSAAVDLLLPRALGASSRLSPDGAEELHGRAVWRVAADPPPGRLPPSQLPPGHSGRSGELLVDASTGIVVSALWRDDAGHAVESAGLTDLVLDEPVDASSFAYEPAPGVTVQSGFGGQLPARFGPAVLVGVVVAAAGEGLARLLGRPATGGGVTWGIRRRRG